MRPSRSAAPTIAYPNVTTEPHPQAPHPASDTARTATPPAPRYHTCPGRPLTLRALNLKATRGLSRGLDGDLTRLQLQGSGAAAQELSGPLRVAGWQGTQRGAPQRSGPGTPVPEPPARCQRQPPQGPSRRRGAGLSPPGTPPPPQPRLPASPGRAQPPPAPTWASPSLSGSEAAAARASLPTMVGRRAPSGPGLRRAPLPWGGGAGPMAAAGAGRAEKRGRAGSASERPARKGAAPPRAT